MMYLLPQQMDEFRYVATTNVFFLLTNAIKLVPYALLGQLATTNLNASLALAPIEIPGFWFGIWLRGRVSQTWFYRVAWAGLLVTGLQLVIQNLERLGCFGAFALLGSCPALVDGPGCYHSRASL